MCGRYTLTHNLQDIAETIMQPQRVEVASDIRSEPRYNIAPTQSIVALVNTGHLQMKMLRWGLIPSWAKEEQIGSKMINARAETLAEKPSFKRLLHNRRCLIVADGFYEWRQEPGNKSKTPMYITLHNHEPFTFAGLWDSWRGPDGEQLQTCTIITTGPNELMASIHNRMPVLLSADARQLWLDTSLHEEAALLPLLKPYESDLMEARPVSRQVNDPRYDSPALISNERKTPGFSHGDRSESF